MPAREFLDTNGQDTPNSIEVSLFSFTHRDHRKRIASGLNTTTASSSACPSNSFAFATLPDQFALERVLQKQLIDPAHQRQVLRALPLRPVVQRGSAHTKQVALTAQAEVGMAGLDHRPAPLPTYHLSPLAKNPAPPSTPRSSRAGPGAPPRVPHGSAPPPSRRPPSCPPRPAASTRSPGSDEPCAAQRSSWIVLSPRSAAQRLQRHLRLELPRESPSRAHCVSLPQSVEYTLATCPIFRDHLRAVG